MNTGKSKKANIICFCGIDGSGKTTLAKNLAKNLKKKGIELNYVYGRHQPVILKPFIYLGSKLFFNKKNKFEDYKGYSNKKKSAIQKHTLLFKIYTNILLFDYYWQIMFKVKIPVMLGKNLVCDRYIFDTIITDLAIDMDYSKEEIKSKIEKWFYITPEPNISFLIDTPEDIAFNRKDDTPSIDYLLERRNIYMEIGKEYDMVILDGTSDLEELKRNTENTVVKMVFNK